MGSGIITWFAVTAENSHRVPNPSLWAVWALCDRTTKIWIPKIEITWRLAKARVLVIVMWLAKPRERRGEKSLEQKRQLTGEVPNRKERIKDLLASVWPNLNI